MFKKIYSRPVFLVGLTDIGFLIVMILAPKYWIFCSIVIALFTYLCIITPNRLVLEDGGDGNTYIYINDSKSRDPENCIIINKDNLLSWEVRDETDATLVVRYLDSKAQENMSLITVQNTTMTKWYFGKRFKKEGVEHQQAAAFFDYINKQRQDSSEYIERDIMPVWLYKKIKAWLNPKTRAKIKARKAKEKAERDAKFDEYKAKQDARRAKAAEAREKEREERENNKENSVEEKNTNKKKNKKQ